MSTALRHWCVTNRSNSQPKPHRIAVLQTCTFVALIITDICSQPQQKVFQEGFTSPRNYFCSESSYLY